ncbi:hypothetical protein GMMP15_1460007 [Candidatus Magnetomoraceae bacterium gMMP-15]
MPVLTTEYFLPRGQKHPRLLRIEVKRVSTNIDKLADKWSRFVEGLVIPGVIKMFKERDIDIEKVSQRLKVRSGTDKMEIDILRVNGEYAVL